MVNTKKLKGKIIEKGFVVEALAKAIGINKSTLYRKLNGQCPITIRDADLIVEELQLTTSEACDIFFSQFVADTRK
ncbi:helix-turn-helix transcriptional regulator [Sporomusa sp. KB1]|jgi:transcriptional regulator with XRE-family HTH domain|nr:helix-turn-helix transcriptional regulator [Sporomusa sp. KB1]TWH46362.1 hypothetical protein Salpa_2343 [Sporomusa sp. KB1]